MKKSIIFFWAAFFAMTSQCFAQTFQGVDDADIHEAFVTHVSGNILIDSYPKQPPNPIQERIPHQTDKGAIWIKGYWSWNNNLNDYIWTSGVWRRPPPGRSWIEGLWQKFDDGWAWIPGFWSDKNADQLTYISLAPPVAIDEDVPSSPQKDYFWNSGYWWYNAGNDAYEWVDGQWELLDPEWVLIPAHYIWRPEGYVFIEAYWDWPMDSLGEAYKPVYIAPGDRVNIVYEPVIIVEPAYIIDHYFYSYPDHTCFYYHHFHYHPHYWENYCCAPQWWLWDSWWGLSWNNQWGLWWWYSNPGYPAPLWVSGNISAILPPPRPALYNRMKRVKPPKFITPRGIVSPNAILKETERVSGHRKPLLPPGKQDREKIWKGVNPKGNREIRPEGRPRPFNPNIKRPSPRKPIIERETGRRIPRAPQANTPRIPKAPGRTIRPRPDSRKPLPDVQRPPTRRPDYNRPPIQRPSRPRPDYNRPNAKKPDFDRPPTQRPSRPRPEFDRPPTRRPSKPRPDYDQPNTKTPDFDRPPTQRPSRPRPEFDRPPTQRPSRPRPEFDRPPTRRPSKPRPDYDQPNTKTPDFDRPPTRRPSNRNPEIMTPSQPTVHYPKGFHGRSSEIQRTREPSQKINPSRKSRVNTPSEIRFRETKTINNSRGNKNQTPAIMEIDNY